MHKKLATDLTSLAHSVLQLKNKEDVLVLKQKAYEIHEKLAVLAYVNEYINTTPNATETKETLLEKIESAEKNEIVALFEAKETQITEVITDEILESEKSEEVEEFIEKPLEEAVVEQPFDELEATLFSATSVVKGDVKDIEEKKTITLEEELDDTISIDVAADLFEKPVAKKSLNDQLHKNLQIGLNDRIAFVKHLFEGSQEEFNRVVSQLNTLKTEKEAHKFIKKMVKPDYNWENQEEYEARFIELVERKFN